MNLRKKLQQLNLNYWKPRQKPIPREKNKSKNLKSR